VDKDRFLFSVMPCEEGEMLRDRIEWSGLWASGFLLAIFFDCGSLRFPRKFDPFGLDPISGGGEVKGKKDAVSKRRLEGDGR